MNIDADCDWVVGKAGRFPDEGTNRAFMMGSGAYLRALALVEGAGVLGRMR